jgi:hypothetical protein
MHGLCTAQLEYCSIWLCYEIRFGAEGEGTGIFLSGLERHSQSMRNSQMGAQHDMLQAMGHYTSI